MKFSTGTRSDLETLLALQQALMGSLGLGHHGSVTSDELLSFVIGMSVEVGEILDILNVKTRPWGTLENGAITRQRVVEEAIDVLFYLLDVFNWLAVDADDIMREYGGKLIVNIARAFSAHAPTPEERRLAYAEFIAPMHEPRVSAAPITDLATLVMVLELFGADRGKFFDDAFFIDPAKKTKEWVRDGSIQTVRLV